MKLKCEKHNRRVLSVPNSRHFLHRTGDQSTCDGKFAVLRDNVSKTTRKFVVMAQKDFPNVFGIASVSTTKDPHAPGGTEIDLTRYTRPQE